MTDEKIGYYKELTKGFLKQNPILVMALGLCPTLAVTTSFDNAIGMGIAATFVLISSAVIISLIRKFVPSDVRIPVFIVIIATFVTIAQLFMKAYSPALNKSLGIFVPLIVVNCIILGRAESFSSKNSVGRSILDATGIGIGFSGAIIVIGIVRELIGTSKLTLFGVTLLNLSGFVKPVMIFILSPGALLTIGLIMALFNLIKEKKES